MRSSTILATLFATAAIASPVHQKLHKRVYEYEVTTEIVTVTVTSGQEPETVRVEKTVIVAPEKVRTTKSRATTTVRPTTKVAITTTTPAPPPPPPTTTTTTTTPPPPPPTTEAPPPPPPTTTPAPAPVVTESVKEPEPEPQPTPEPESQPEPQPEPEQTQETPTTSSSGDAVRDAALNAHNAYRAKHHAGSLSWDDNLASSAAELAGGCTNKHGLIVGGQNIAAKGFSGQSSPGDASLMTEAVDNWYNEVSMFGGLYGQSQVSDTAVLHFTQVVWKDTTKLGCAVHNCGTEGNIFPGFNAFTIVCNYQAAGNFAGQYAVNVQAP